MAVAGLIGTGDFAGGVAGGGERPLNWRQGILMRYPNGHAPLVGLTSAMKKKVTDDPNFNWWERELSNIRLTLGANITAVATSITVAADPFGFGGSLQLKAGHVLRVEQTEELLLITADPTVETGFTCSRGFAGSTATAIADITAAGVNPNLMIVGSIFEEGADTPQSVRYRPSKQSNYTQIFRNSLKATRTAMKTRLRTVDEVQDAKKQALLYHSIEMEYGLIFGLKFEGTGPGGEPRRMTGGLISFIPTANVLDQAGAAMDLEAFEDVMIEAFRFGSQEKVAFCGNRAMLAMQRVVRLNASLEITPTIKEFGMDVRRIFTPFGTLVMKTHPLFNQIQSGTTGGTAYQALDTWMLILDMANITYRNLRDSDTQYLPDRQSNGLDALTSEYLTECGLEVNHGKTHYLIKGLRAAQVDD
jgi:hypothetical protein